MMISTKISLSLGSHDGHQGIARSKVAVRVKEGWLEKETKKRVRERLGRKREREIESEREVRK